MGDMKDAVSFYYDAETITRKEHLISVRIYFLELNKWINIQRALECPWILVFWWHIIMELVFDRLIQKPWAVFQCDTHSSWREYL